MQGSLENRSPRSPLVKDLFSNPIFLPLICVTFIIITLMDASLFQRETYLRAHGFSDFQDYYVVGRTVAQGHADCGYHEECLRQAQTAVLGRSAKIPWAYPPQFTALMAILAPFSSAGAFIVFMLTSFGFFVAVLRKLAGRYAPFALALVLPAMQINLRAGQNGFLTAGLLGLFALLWLRKDDRSGLVLGAMIIKPHLAIAAAAFVLLQKAWARAIWAVCFVVGSSVAVTILFGWNIWGAFRQATSASIAMILAGDFPIERMSSVYAAAYRFGLDSASAMAIHIVFAGAVLLGLTVATRRCGDVRTLLAITMTATAFLSPYNYDYDLTILAVALALMAPKLVELLSGLEVALLGGLLWASQANMWIKRAAINVWPGVEGGEQVWSLSAIFLTASVLLVFNVMRRDNFQDRRNQSDPTIA